jgi:hypothetical protein
MRSGMTSLIRVTTWISGDDSIRVGYGSCFFDFAGRLAAGRTSGKEIRCLHKL